MTHCNMKMQGPLWKTFLRIETKYTALLLTMGPGHCAFGIPMKNGSHSSSLVGQSPGFLWVQLDTYHLLVYCVPRGMNSIHGTVIWALLTPMQDIPL